MFGTKETTLSPREPLALLGVIAVALLVTVSLLVPWQRKSDISRLRGPARKSWVWGNELEMFQSPFGDYHRQCIEEYGHIYKLKGALAHPDVLVIADPVAVAHIFGKNIRSYWRSKFIRGLALRIVGKSLVWVEGESATRKMRRFFLPTFSRHNIRQMSSAIHETAARMHSQLSDAVLEADGSLTSNITPFLNGATLDIIGHIGFGHDFGLGSTPEAKRITQTMHDQNTLSVTKAGFAAGLVLRALPKLTSIPLPVFKSQAACRTTIWELAPRIIHNSEDPAVGRRDLLSSILRQHPNIPKNELYDHITTAIIAGHETTSTSLTWTLWELAKNASVQARLREEILSFHGDPTYEDFQNKLPFLDACCKEGLRLHPSTFYTERVAQRRDMIPLGFQITLEDGTEVSQLVVEQGQLINFPIIRLNRLRSIWGPDADLFIPERWLREDHGFVHPTIRVEGWSNLFTFIDGPRQCPGIHLAVYEWKVLMAMLIRHFSFHDTGAEIVGRYCGALNHPLVAGQEENGPQMPLRIVPI